MTAMALFTYCNQYEGCMLSKRKCLDGENADLRLYHIFSPCKEFERMEDLGKGHYEEIKTHLVSAQENVRIRSKPVINLDNLMGITENELLEGPVPGDLYLEFLNLNMNDTGQILDFLWLCQENHVQRYCSEKGEDCPERFPGKRFQKKVSSRSTSFVVPARHDGCAEGSWNNSREMERNPGEFWPSWLAI